MLYFLNKIRLHFSAISFAISKGQRLVEWSRLCVTMCKKKTFALFKEWETSFYIFKDLKEFNRKSYEVRWEGKAWNITGVFFNFLIQNLRPWDFKPISVFILGSQWSEHWKKAKRKRARKLIMMGCFPVAFPYQKAAGVVLVFSNLFRKHSGPAGQKAAFWDVSLSSLGC